MVLMDDLQSNPVHISSFNINIESRVLLKRDGESCGDKKEKVKYCKKDMSQVLIVGGIR